MRRIRRILVAIKNPNARSQPAITKAAQLARAFRAELELYHAISEPLCVDVYMMPDQNLHKTERLRRSEWLACLERMAERLRDEGLRVDTAAEWDFPAYESIVRRAARTKADLIVAERHARPHVTPWLLHFTDWELLRLSPVPVLLVKNNRPYHHPKILAAIDPAHAFAKPTKLDAEILSLATSVTDALRGTLHAVHAYVPGIVGLKPSELTTPDITRRLESMARARAQADLEAILVKTPIARQRRHLVSRHPADAIPETARKIGSRLVVMGAISRSGLKRLFIGNTAERVVDQLSCDVLIVKPAHFAKRVPRARRGPHLVVITAMPPTV
jgi:universal stress protein E